MKKKFLKTNEAARYLEVSRSSLTNWVKQGLIEGGVTPGGHYRFTREDLDEFAERRGLILSKNRYTGKTRILVVEDDDSFREFIREALDVFTGFELKECRDGMQGALLLGSWQPDIVLLDIRMPNMNGVDFCRVLRENDDTSEAKVIVASAFLSPEIKEELELLKVDAVLEKPVRLGTLVASVQKLADLQLK